MVWLNLTQVFSAEHWGVVHIMENYSEALRRRVTGMGDLALAQFPGFSGTKVLDSNSCELPENFAKKSLGRTTIVLITPHRVCKALAVIITFLG